MLEVIGLEVLNHLIKPPIKFRGKLIFWFYSRWASLTLTKLTNYFKLPIWLSTFSLLSGTDFGVSNSNCSIMFTKQYKLGYIYYLIIELPIVTTSQSEYCITDCFLTLPYCKWLAFVLVCRVALSSPMSVAYS